MERENKLKKLVSIFRNLAEMENIYLERDLSEAYFLKSVNTELREIIMICYLNTDLLTMSRFIKEESMGDYYALVYTKVTDMQKNINKNLQVMQSLSNYIKDEDSLQYIEDSIQYVEAILKSVEESINTFNSAKNHMH
jgi:hypothetical protein